MNLYAETALIALAGVGTFTILAKAQDAYRYFLRNRLDEVTSEDRDNFGSVFGGHPEKSLAADTWPHSTPYCHGTYTSGSVAAERDCGNCRQALSCIQETGVRRSRARSVFDDTPVKQTPPNMGGLGNPEYQGPNYVEGDEFAESMKGVPHYFVDQSRNFFDAPYRLDLPMNPLSGDLAWSYELGRVAPDGSIWSAPDERVQSGTALVHASEMVKAARFGWTYESDSIKPAYVLAKR
ncbi:MAG TPA: hypothetical protein VK181_12565 [Rhizobium sp.]|nr:hypothetical protein [Rhizobium sp.]